MSTNDFHDKLDAFQNKLGKLLKGKPQPVANSAGSGDTGLATTARSEPALRQTLPATSSGTVGGISVVGQSAGVLPTSRSLGAVTVDSVPSKPKPSSTVEDGTDSGVVGRIAELERRLAAKRQSVEPKPSQSPQQRQQEQDLQPQNLYTDGQGGRGFTAQRQVGGASIQQGASSFTEVGDRQSTDTNQDVTRAQTRSQTLQEQRAAKDDAPTNQKRVEDQPMQQLETNTLPAHVPVTSTGQMKQAPEPQRPQVTESRPSSNERMDGLTQVKSTTSQPYRQGTEPRSTSPDEERLQARQKTRQGNSPHGDKDISVDNSRSSPPRTQGVEPKLMSSERMDTLAEEDPAQPGRGQMRHATSQPRLQGADSRSGQNETQTEISPDEERSRSQARNKTWQGSLQAGDTDIPSNSMRVDDLNTANSARESRNSSKELPDRQVWKEPLDRKPSKESSGRVTAKDHWQIAERMVVRDLRKNTWQEFTSSGVDASVDPKGEEGISAPRRSASRQKTWDVQPDDKDMQFGSVKKVVSSPERQTDLKDQSGARRVDVNQTSGFSNQQPTSAQPDASNARSMDGTVVPTSAAFDERPSAPRRYRRHQSMPPDVIRADTANSSRNTYPNDVSRSSQSGSTGSPQRYSSQSPTSPPERGTSDDDGKRESSSSTQSQQTALRRSRPWHTNGGVKGDAAFNQAANPSGNMQGAIMEVQPSILRRNTYTGGPVSRIPADFVGRYRFSRSRSLNESTGLYESPNQSGASVPPSARSVTLQSGPEDSPRIPRRLSDDAPMVRTVSFSRNNSPERPYTNYEEEEPIELDVTDLPTLHSNSSLLERLRQRAARDEDDVGSAVASRLNLRRTPSGLKHYNADVNGDEDPATSRRREKLRALRQRIGRPVPDKIKSYPPSLQTESGAGCREENIFRRGTLWLWRRRLASDPDLFELLGASREDVLAA